MFLLSSVVYPPNTKVASIAAFNTVLSDANPGDTITLANQTWQDVLIEFSGKNGTAAAPIVLRAETFGSVIITGNSDLRIGENCMKLEFMS